MSKTKIDIEEVRAFMATQPETTRCYLGCDSERFKIKGVWYADYTVVLVVHIASSKGCKIFAEIQRERDVDQNMSKPFNRMMTETRKVCELYDKLRDVLYDFEIEVHLDINPSENAGSNVAYQAAVGYVKGMCNVVPMAKPNSWAASYGADRAKELGLARFVA